MADLLVFVLAAPVVLIAGLYIVVLLVNRAQRRDLEAGRRVTAVRQVDGDSGSVLRRVAAAATSGGGIDVRSDQEHVLSWRQGVSLLTWGQRFRAEVRSASPGVGGHPRSEVRVGSCLRFGLYDWGDGRRKIGQLLARVDEGG